MITLAPIHLCQKVVVKKKGRKTSLPEIEGEKCRNLIAKSHSLKTSETVTSRFDSAEKQTFSTQLLRCAVTVSGTPRITRFLEFQKLRMEYSLLIHAMQQLQLKWGSQTPFRGSRDKAGGENTQVAFFKKLPL